MWALCAGWHALQQEGAAIVEETVRRGGRPLLTGGQISASAVAGAASTIQEAASRPSASAPPPSRSPPPPAGVPPFWLLHQQQPPPQQQPQQQQPDDSRSGTPGIGLPPLAPPGAAQLGGGLEQQLMLAVRQALQQELAPLRQHVEVLCQVRYCISAMLCTAGTAGAVLLPCLSPFTAAAIARFYGQVPLPSLSTVE